MGFLRMILNRIRNVFSDKSEFSFPIRMKLVLFAIVQHKYDSAAIRSEVFSSKKLMTLSSLIYHSCAAVAVVNLVEPRLTANLI